MEKNFYDCPELLKQFLYYLRTVRNRSPKTVDAYYVDIRTFFRYLMVQHHFVSEAVEFTEISILSLPQETILSVTLAEVYEYLYFLANIRQNSVATRARKVSALRTFYGYLKNKANLLKENPMDQLDLPTPKRALPKHLSLEESRSLLSLTVDGADQARNHCIFTLFLNCGMRLSELVGINKRDITENTIRITGKGNKQRTVYLNEACLSALNAYLSVRNAIPDAKDKEALFLSKQKKRITNRRVQQILEESLQRLGLQEKGYTIHKLRHTAATLMYQYGNVDIRILQEILGHENLGTTEIYTHVANRQIQQASEQSPLAHFIPEKDKYVSDND